jgi:hypothetical protein
MMQMGSIEIDDVKPLLEAFVAGAFPWISQLKALKIHFEIEDFDVSSISNFFASLFAVSIFGFFQYLHPSQLSLLLY